MDMSVESKSKFAAPHRQWFRLQMSEKFSSGTFTPNNWLFFKCNWRLDKEPTKFNDGRLKNW